MSIGQAHPFADSSALVPDSEEPAASQEAAGSESCDYWVYCPNCSARLHNAGCKYRCPGCHYFMSCSDFD